MNVSTLFVLLIDFCSVICEYVKARSLAPLAISSIVNNYFVKSESEIDVIYFGVRGGVSEAFVQEILRNKQETIAIKLSKGGKEFSWKNRLNISSITIFDSPQNFKEMAKSIKWLSNSKRRYKHLVHAPQLSRTDIINNIQDGFSIDNVNFIMNENDQSIELVSSFMFTRNKCHSNQLETINRFMKNTSRWVSRNFYPKKYQNLYGCILDVGIYAESRIIQSLKTIAKSFNFEINLIPIRAGEETSNLDLIFKQMASVNRNHLISSVPHLIDRVAFAIPPGELYTPLEKMFLMFEFEVWIAIAITLLIGLVIIQLINCFSPKIQSFVFGKKIQTPTLNMISIFLNGGQLKVPGRNFARFIFILFIAWSLIIRTCYQSILFNLFQSDPRKPPAKNIEDLVENGFIFYGGASSVPFKK